MKKANLRIRSTAGVCLAAIVLTLALAAVTLTACDDGGGGGGPVYLTIANTAGLNDAVNQIKTGGNGRNYTLTIVGTVPVSGSSGGPTFGSAVGLTVTLSGSGVLTLNGDGAMFILSGSSASARQRLIIDGPELRGKAANVLPVVGVFGAAVLELRGGKITGNGNTATDNSANSGGVYVALNGAFAMSGGEISGNSGDKGGGVCIEGGSFSMTGGEISGNTATAGGGGVYLNQGSLFKTAGVINGDNDITVGNGNTTDNTVTAGNEEGHAVYYYANTSNQYYRDATLGADASGNISTAVLPTATGVGNTVGNWIKK
jgi:hypothetical protein